MECHKKNNTIRSKKTPKDSESKGKVGLSTFCSALLFANFDRIYEEIAQSSFRVILVFTEH